VNYQRVTNEFAEASARPLRWHDLSDDTRRVLEGKLRGLYEHTSDESAFDALAVDKQQALLTIARRFIELNLWASVRRVENVYGAGGVGINFIAWPVLESTLRCKRMFTARFASHKDARIGFLERRRQLAALHFLCANKEHRRWSAHFDLYSPLAFPLGSWRHLLHEKLRGETPSWFQIKRALWH